MIKVTGRTEQTSRAKEGVHPQAAHRAKEGVYPRAAHRAKEGVHPRAGTGQGEGNGTRVEDRQYPHCGAGGRT